MLIIASKISKFFVVKGNASVNEIKMIDDRLWLDEICGGDFWGIFERKSFSGLVNFL